MTTNTERKPVDVLAVIADLAAIVRLHEGNRDAGIVALLEDAGEARAAVAEAFDKARTLMNAMDNIVAAGQAPAGYLQYADDMRAALARVGGA